MFDLQQIDKDWSLFLDRDGVINHEKEGSYVFHYGEFDFYADTKQALRILASRFGRIVVVTNQRGVGKGLMTTEDLQDIHGKMVAEIRASAYAEEHPPAKKRAVSTRKDKKKAERMKRVSKQRAFKQRQTR